MGCMHGSVSAPGPVVWSGQPSEDIRSGARRANHAYPAIMTVLEFLDSAAVRRWCGVAAEALGAVRDQLNALNVFPVADSDTGTNLHLTMLSAVRALDELPEAAGPHEVWQALAHGVLLGAQGNSGVIVSQFLRGLADVCAPASPCDGTAIQQALAHAARLSRAAVGEPVEGTVLTVAFAGAASAAAAGKSLAAVARAAARGARMELARTTAKLDVLARAGVVDAGGAGLCVLLDALAVVVTGTQPETYVIPAPAASRALAGHTHASGSSSASPPGGSAGYEVMYLLEAADEPVAMLRDRLGQLGNSLVVVGGEGLWNVHVHVADAGAAIEAGMAAGRPYRIRVTHLTVSGHADEETGAVQAGVRPGGAATPSGASVGPSGASFAPQGAPRGSSGGAVVAIVSGAGAAALFEAEGAVVVRHDGERALQTRDLLGTVRAAGASTGQVAILPDDPEVARVAESAAVRARRVGLTVVVAPARTAVQCLAALAVHDPARAFGDDAAAMADAAAATRWGRLTLPQAGGPIGAQAGRSAQAVGSLGDDVVATGADPAAVAMAMVGGLLADESELVTLITGSPPGVGASTGSGVAAAVAAHLEATRPGVEVVTYDGGDTGYVLLVGAE